MNILFLARISNFFTGDTIYKKPLGGSESALFYIAKELTSLGHKVTIFNNCGEKEGKFEGVDYKKFTTLHDFALFSQNYDTDILVSFRDLSAFLFPLPAKRKIWWGHDDFSNMWNQSHLKKWLGILVLKLAGFLAKKLIDKFFVPSNWLGKILSEYLLIPQEKIFCIRNGVHLPYFSCNDSTRDKNKLVYASVPDRGLDLLLNFFPEIRKEIPSAQLHVFCARFQSPLNQGIDEQNSDLGMIKKADLERAKKIYQRINQAGVLFRGTVLQSELAQELKKSYLLLYPSHELLAADFYAETSSIVALQAQAAGAPVVSSFQGALPESVKDKETGVLIKGNPYSQEYKNNFVSAVINLMKDQSIWETMSRNAQKHIFMKYSWNLIAQEWEEEFKRLLK